MSEFRTALASLRSVIGLAGRRLPKTAAVAKAADRMGGEEGRIDPPREDFLLEVKRNLIDAARGPGGIASAAKRDIKHAPWLLWRDLDPLPDLSGLMPAILATAETSARGRRTLIEAWIEYCDPARPGMDACGRRLSELARQSDDARLAFWRQAQERFEFFDIRRGPYSVAMEILHRATPMPELLAASGLDQRAKSGYARLVQGHLVGDLPSPLRGRDGHKVFERASAYLAPGAKLRFKEPRPAARLAEALTSPWLNSGVLPGEPLRSCVQDFLLRHLGDPRVSGAAVYWGGADAPAAKLMRGWLARASLEAFFEVVADHADDNFKYRRAFWTACLQRAQQAGKFFDVWLALGANVHAHAGAIEELHGSFARLKGASGNQSVFLMQIDRTIFCEWSHVGKIRAWPEGAHGSPRIGAIEYARDEVVAEGLLFPKHPQHHSGGSSDGLGLSHHSGDTGYWQASAAELIARRCGLRLEPRDWMPK